MGFIDTIKLSKFEKFLNSYGYYRQRQNGSHITFKKVGINGSFTIATHKKEVPFYNIKQAIRAIGISQSEFEKKIRDI
ncbi:MAG: type II toxin-antitoxin system HicA family toxin [Elusimicrobiota bacterium]|jgi:predicted RNA binding protein YcfA (HicA-like mRNA interferase family)|nr:type II toxin-antitoxin system HicA family toxin [Elusimicrobiota bacterium]